MPPPKRQRVKEESDSSDYEESEYGVESDEEDHHDSVAAGTHTLGLSQDYVPSWTEADAFREWYQNWELLGYIRFIKQTGTLELANFSAALDPRHLSLGGTTKRDDSKSAGTHGEGFEVAALVMTRNNRMVHIESSSAYWKFGFLGTSKDKFSCQITKPATSTIKERRDALLSETRNGRARTTLTSYIHRDVIVRISTPNCHKAITAKDFWDWSRIYLKGLRVSSHESDFATYSYGYDFASGRINRDRKRKMNQKEEARIVASIWELAVAERPDLTKEYIRLFSVIFSLDVAFADTVMSKKMAEHVWQYLLKDAPDCFFYANDPDSQSNVYLINEDLNKQARILPRELWKTLRKFKLPRTPKEHIDHKFLSSEAITLPADLFAISIDRMLQAAMQLDYRLKKYLVTYVKSDHSSIDVRQNLSDSRLFIHEKWLRFDAAHQDISCDISDMSKAKRKQADVFACDHVVEDLFDIVLRTVMGATDSDALRIANIRSKARRLFRQTPRDIQIHVGSLPGQLRVSWACNDPGIISKHHGDDIDFQVRLHRDDSCRTKEHTLVLTWNTRKAFRNRKAPRDSCSCPMLKAPLSACSATFDGLDPQQKYFPMVARDKRGAFFGLAPPSIAPMRGPDHDGGTEELQEDDGGANPKPAASTPSSKEWIKDQETWREWHAEDLPTKISGMFSTRNACKCDVADTPGETSFESRRLNFTFEKDQYVKIKDISRSFGTYIALVHDVSPGKANCLNTPHLLITKYSSFDHTKLLWDSKTSLNDCEKNGHKELLLHCTDTKNMGTLPDSEVVQIDDIEWLEPTGPNFYITHCVQRPDDLDADEFFCRFARSVYDDFLTMLPISPHLLAPRHRRKMRGFPDASPGWVTDLTPDVLGPMEGFSSAGFLPFAAFGFDEKRHATWKVRHPTCPVFDGCFPHIVEDIDKGRVPGLLWPSSNAPMTLLASVKNVNFALSEENKVMPSVESFLGQLSMAEHAFESGHPDFTVIQLPPATLHPLTVDRLCKSVVYFLEKYNAIRVDASSVQNHNVLQTRRLLTMIVSPHHGIAAVPMTQAHQQSSFAGQEAHAITRDIAELSFCNSRATGTGILCSLPSGISQDRGAPKLPCYNHATGFTLTEGETQVVDLGLKNIDFVTYSNRGLVHPVREDSLTVREFARVQGFPDDFVFYGSGEDQYDQVTLAQPPPVARAAAECIKTVILRSKAVKLGDDNRTARQNKRRRQDDEE
ncbi:putative modification methylase [Colletotrichum aenigma]|uniref:putative modification methylase n=1 Tax=Colletotrichum aenigma TaxID=1215731 RepID=UPI0018729AD3|nr:putative modification methylase [Colletotrichum aenigma]KAF5525034.1 putative modification methylase [Colletotrichum aenigma]